MGGESPVVELYDSNGNPLAVQNGSAIPASTPAIMIAGSDGTNSRYILVDSSGNQVMVGAGTAGTPAGGVVSIQGVASGTVVPVSGTISASQTGNVDAGNSSTTPLAGNGTFSGTAIDVSVYGVITIFVFADQAGTLNIEFSTNNTNWDDINSYAVSASTALSVQFGPQAKFFRVVYQNGSSAQSVFRLQTIERPITSFPETVPISYIIQANDDAILTKSVITGKTTGGGGGFVDVKVNPSGTLTVDASNSTGLTGTFTANQGTSPWVTNVSQFGGNNVVTGTGASGVGIPRVTVSNDSNVLATQSGTWTVIATQTTAANLRAQTASESTTATTTGTVAALMGGAVTTAAPTYTTGQMDPLSLTTAGALRVDGSSVTQPISGTVTANQGTPNTLANKWPVQVTDGTNTMPTGDVVGRAIFHQITDGTNGPVAVKASTTAPVLADPALVVNLSPNRPATYAASTNGVVVGTNTATGVASIAYIFHTATNTKRIEIYRIVASTGLECGANHDFTLRGAFITAENATPGGTAQTVNPFDRSDPASTITSTTGVFRTGATGAPTRVTGDLISEEMYVNSGGANQKVLFDIHFTGKPIVLRASTAEGFEIRMTGNNNGNLSQAPDISVTMYWMEI